MENNHQEKDGFTYTYSAKEQAELRSLREKYAPKPEESKLDRLRRLDRGVTQKAQAISIALGVIGSLLLGGGMSLIMTELGDYLVGGGALAVLLGVLVGVVGGVLLSLAYPTYQLVMKKERERVAPEILRLTDELLHK